MKINWQVTLLSGLILIVGGVILFITQFSKALGGLSGFPFASNHGAAGYNPDLGIAGIFISLLGLGLLILAIVDARKNKNNIQ